MADRVCCLCSVKAARLLLLLQSSQEARCIVAAGTHLKMNVGMFRAGWIPDCCTSSSHARWSVGEESRSPFCAGLCGRTLCITDAIAWIVLPGRSKKTLHNEEKAMKTKQTNKNPPQISGCPLENLLPFSLGVSVNFERCKINERSLFFLFFSTSFVPFKTLQ